MKKILFKFVAVLMCCALFTPSLTMSDAKAAGGDWKDAFAKKIIEHVNDLNKKKSGEHSGITVSLVDLDFDGIPEMDIGYVYYASQIEFFSDSYIYLFDGKQAVKISSQRGTGVGVYQGNSWEQNSRNGLRLLRNAKTKEVYLVHEYFSNEGAYDFGLKYEKLVYNKTTLKFDVLANYSLPAYIENDYEYIDERATTYFTGKQKEFYSSHEVIASAPAKQFFLDGLKGKTCAISTTYDKVYSLLGGYTAPYTPAPPSVDPAVFNYRVGSGRLNLRSSASTSASVLSTLKNGDRLKALETNGAWTKVENAYGTVGWVASANIGKSPYTGEVNAKVNVLSGTLKLRADKSSSAKILQELKNGNTLTLLDIKSSTAWVKVKASGGVEGWVASANVGIR